MSRAARFLSAVLLLFLASAPPAAGGQGKNRPALPKTVLRIYDVRELIYAVPDYPGPMVGEISAYAGLPIFTQPPPAAMINVATLVEMIKRRIDPASWAPARGTSIEERSGRMCVVQTPEVHRRIAALLSFVRGRAKLQLSVRCLVVAVDARAAAGLRKRRSRLLSAQEAGELVKAAGRKGLLASPQLVCLNAQRNHVGALSRLEFVAGLQASGDRAVPRVESLMLGTVLDVRPTLTCERDAADVELRLTFGGNCRVRRRRVSGSFTVQLARDSKGRPIPGSAPQLVPYRGTIDLPDLAAWAVRTNVTVPLGKYALAAAFPLPRGVGAPRTAVVLLGVDTVASQPAGVLRVEGNPVQGQPVQRIYDVRELTYAMPHFPGPWLGRPWRGQGSGGVVMMAPPPNCAFLPGTLQDVIKRTIEPRSWGAGGASIEERNGQLIVVHKPAVHRRIAKLLSELRARHKKQVQVRALVVAADERAAGRLCVRRPTVLSDAEVRKLLAAGGRIAAEARITGHNSQRVYVYSGRQANRVLYSTGLPAVESPRSGLAFDVLPLLSTDGKAATLTLRVSLVERPSKSGEQREVYFRAALAVPLGKYVVAGAMKQRPGAKGGPLLVLVRADVTD